MLHPSPHFTFPSSHCSPLLVFPLPQEGDAAVTDAFALGSAKLRKLEREEAEGMRDVVGDDDGREERDLHILGFPLHVHPLSTLHCALHPSPSLVFLSSHFSPLFLFPLPQEGEEDATDAPALGDVEPAEMESGEAEEDTRDFAADNDEREARDVHTLGCPSHFHCDST